MRMISMCETSSAVPRGFYRIRSIRISLALLTTLTFNTQGYVEPDVLISTEDNHVQSPRGSPEAAKSQIFLSDENIRMGHSGDPWDSQKDSNDSKNTTNRRSKRSVLHLYNMIVCATGCNPISYKGYGCYCGFLGSGTAVDGIDQCCRMHDRCYDATECPSYLEYFVPYFWKCDVGYGPVCAIQHGSWGGAGSCAQRLCECDRAFSQCLKRFPCPTSKAMCTTSPWRLVQNVFMVF